MLDFLRSLIAHRAYVSRFATLALAMLCAELFYKFHSFTLESIAFLATWLALDLTVDAVRGRFARA